MKTKIFDLLYVDCIIGLLGSTADVLGMALWTIIDLICPLHFIGCNVTKEI